MKRGNKKKAELQKLINKNKKIKQCFGTAEYSEKSMVCITCSLKEGCKIAKLLAKNRYFNFGPLVKKIKGGKGK